MPGVDWIIIACSLLGDTKGFWFRGSALVGRFVLATLDIEGMIEKVHFVFGLRIHFFLLFGFV